MTNTTHPSTGPRTPEGKAISSQNALKHGFTSREFVIPDDLRADFETLEANLRAEFEPESELHHQAFRQYLRASWNLFRLDIEEARLFNEKGLDAILSADHAHLQRYRRQQERSRAEALKELRLIAAEREEVRHAEEQYQQRVRFMESIGHPMPARRETVRFVNHSPVSTETPVPPLTKAAA